MGSTAIEVAKLRLKCTEQQRDRTRFAIEDGLRTSIPDDRRLILIRRMRVAGEIGSLQPAHRQLAVRDGWLEAIAGACRGGEDGASGANCVWFASREEAEALLLSRLLAGKSVDAWFWKLAVPEWRGRTLPTWVSECLSEAVRMRQDARLLAIARCFIAAGAVDRLIAMLGSPEDARPGPLAMPQSEQSPLAPTLRPGGGLALEVAESGGPAIANSMPNELRQAIAHFDRAGDEGQAIALAIVRAWTLQRSPALALSSAHLDTIVAAVTRLVTSPQSHRPPLAVATGPARPLGVSAGSGNEPSLLRSQAAASRQSPGVRPKLPSAAMGAETRMGPPALADTHPLLEQADLPTQQGTFSAYAGLWLVIPSLIELGFREWLSNRPGLLGDNPGSLLLREIAQHHRVPIDDPVLAVLGPPVSIKRRPDWARLWRHGLDRWLRRIARRRLHDIVNRQGELDSGDLRLIIHYPAANADIALRRRALDRDPGWIDWLGLSVRYNFGGREDWL